MTAKGPKPVFEYLGDGTFQAEARFVWTCDQDFVVHEKYRMDVIAERSKQSHDHYMVMVEETWLNLPDSRRLQFPTPEHLRKWALVQCGFCSQSHTVFSTKQDALTAAAMIRKTDKFAVLTVHDNVVTKYEAESQSYKSMDRKRFQASKDKVLELLADMIHITPKQLERHSNGAMT